MRAHRNRAFDRAAAEQLLQGGTAGPAELRWVLGAAAAHNEVLKDPGPQVLRPTLVGAPLAFELCVWHDAHGPVRKQLTSDLNRLIDQRLRAAGFQYA